MLVTAITMLPGILNKQTMAKKIQKNNRVINNKLRQLTIGTMASKRFLSKSIISVSCSESIF